MRYIWNVEPYIVKTQIQPKLNWTEFEVRLHSYCEVHPTTTTTNYLLLLYYLAPVWRQHDVTTAARMRGTRPRLPQLVGPV